MAAPVYPWREDNQFELMVDGDCFFPRLLQAMRQARQSIDIELYLVESGHSTERVTEILTDAVARGVRVRCLFDGAGSRSLQETDRERLRQAGVELRFYNPLNLLGGRANLHRDHRKLILVDEHTAFIGGAGFTDEFCIPDEAGQCLWHEQML
ncbi:MAG: phosphatidylserine/phosphatidylglycerophosphate/cardiolipin synthase family protein, partial [Gammaproteobacteria bacterium]|nr:phosphatidylserine/phosphatidylglycerophosphate/cardiolipin synthase family protein [Gammaproteobacteria bacterium]